VHRAADASGGLQILRSLAAAMECQNLVNISRAIESRYRVTHRELSSQLLCQLEDRIDVGAQAIIRLHEHRTGRPVLDDAEPNQRVLDRSEELGQETAARRCAKSWGVV